MALTEPTQIFQPIPVDTTGVRDAGIASVVLLAVSLGWNFTKRVNGPLLIIARDGMTRRLPTDTSVRMSVFQSALSSVMVHTDPDVEPTIELIDRIIEITKPSKDHERRLRLAVGETVAQHRKRIAAIEAEPQGSREPQPLTTRVGTEWVEEAIAETVPLTGHLEEPEGQLLDAIATGFPPADGGDHGALIEIRPFMAQHQGRAEGFVDMYESDTSNERVWEDGYIDYECKVCGRAFKNPKAVGGHRQIHWRHGSGDIPRPEKSAHERSETRTRGVPRQRSVHRRSQAEIEADIEFVEDLPAEPVPYEAPAVETAEPKSAVAAVTEAGDELSPDAVLAVIRDLVLPHHTVVYEARITALEAENDRLQEALDKVEKDWNALRELISGR